MHHGSKKRLAMLGAAAVPAAAMFASQANAAITVSVVNLGTAAANTNGPQSGWTAFALMATADTGDVLTGCDFSSSNTTLGVNKGVYGQLLQRWSYSSTTLVTSKTPMNAQSANSTSIFSLDTHFLTVGTQGYTIPGTTPITEDNNQTNPGLTGFPNSAPGATGARYGTGTALHGGFSWGNDFRVTQQLAYIVLKDGTTGSAVFDLSETVAPGPGVNTGFAFALSFSSGPGSSSTVANKIISLTSAAPTSYGTKLTQGAGANQATFDNGGSADSTIHVLGSNSSYVPGHANAVGGAGNGQNLFNVEATGWSPNTDQEVYALNIKVNGLDPTAGQISAIINDINGSNTGNVTAGPVSGQFAAVFPGYDILLTAAAGTLSPEFLGVDFSSDSTTTGVTVTDVAAVPEPASAAGILLGAAGLLLGRRKRNA
jgi:hypothetical protein